MQDIGLQWQGRLHLWLKLLFASKAFARSQIKKCSSQNGGSVVVAAIATRTAIASLTSHFWVRSHASSCWLV
jgi:hypothetical protein